MDTERIPHRADAFRRTAAPRLTWRDARTAVLWVLAIIPPSFGFWLVAADVAGVRPDQTKTFVLAGMLTLGLATLAQVCAGHRISLYEGPASAYLAAVIVVGAGGHSLAAIGGGLIVAGITVVLLGLLGFDRLLLRFFTPLTGMVFVLVVTVAVIPTTLQRALTTSSAQPLGTIDGWATGLAVVGVGVVLQRWRVLRPYALLGALLAGVAASLLVSGVPEADLSGGLAAPPLLPWGAPQFSLSVALPFVIAAFLVAFNTVAAVEVACDVQQLAKPPRSAARALTVHGAAQIAGTMFGNALGTVARLDSMPIALLLDSRRRATLALAALLVMALALVQPFMGLVAALPLTVSAALLALMLGTMTLTTLRRLWPLGNEARLVAAVALLPSIAWTPLQHSLSPTGQLIGNPMLWGVGLGLALERAFAHRRAGVLQLEGRA